MDFESFISPVAEQQFLSANLGLAALHIPAPAGGEPLLGWDRFNELLAIRSHWSEANLKLVMDSRPIAPDFYIETVDTLAGPMRRANLAQVDVFLAMGASLVGHAIQDIAPEVDAVCEILSERFAARVEANAYCSFEGVQAFASHCDLHDVFVLQCEGKKIWNIYQNRAASPVQALEGEGAQEMIDAAKGPVMLRVKLRPGDRLYIPRGFYHDAIASGPASLHLTFSIAPLTGLVLFEMLQEQALEEERFRVYLPDARIEQGEVLARRLEDLAGRIAGMASTAEFARKVAKKQSQLSRRAHRFNLPNCAPLRFYARTDLVVQLETGPGAAKAMIGGGSLELGNAADAVAWLLSRPGFSVEEVAARYPYVEPVELDAVIGGLEQLRAIVPYVPARK